MMALAMVPGMSNNNNNNKNKNNNKDYYNNYNYNNNNYSSNNNNKARSASGFSAPWLRPFQLFAFSPYSWLAFKGLFSLHCLVTGHPSCLVISLRGCHRSWQVVTQLGGQPPTAMEQSSDMGNHLI